MITLEMQGQLTHMSKTPCQNRGKRGVYQDNLGCWLQVYSGVGHCRLFAKLIDITGWLS